jgi:hypothetical protein
MGWNDGSPWKVESLYEFQKRWKAPPMTNHMPPVPPANRSNKGPKDETDPGQTAATKAEPQNIAEQGETANIKQNTTNKGFFQGRRVK